MIEVDSFSSLSLNQAMLTAIAPEGQPLPVIVKYGSIDALLALKILQVERQNGHIVIVVE
jgi:hypothetical protein